MKRTTIASVLVCFSAILIYTSCAKIDTTDLGNGLIPAVDNVHTFEMIVDVMTDNKLFDDSTRMYDQQDHAVGIIENDIEFGKTTAAIYSSFTPVSYRTYPFIKRDSVVIDSVVLSLSYTTTFGDSTSMQQFEVREIEPEFDFRDSAYFINEPDFPVVPTLVGSKEVNFIRLNDPVQYVNGDDTVNTSNELRIHLDTAWARRFVDYDTSTAYNNDSAFKRNFRGLQIVAGEGSLTKNALAYFDLDDNTRSRITFYCRIQNNGKTDTIAPYFQHSLDPHANLIRRTPANAYQMAINNAGENDEKLYIQAAPGSYVEVKIPALDTLSNRVIHRAELIVEKHPSDQDFYSAPALLFVDALSTTGDSVFTIRNDYIPINSAPGYDVSSLGGIFKNDQYIFNLARYIQSVVTKKLPYYTLRVHAPFAANPFYMYENTTQVDPRSAFVPVLVNTPVAKGRVVVYGGGSSDPKRMRLRIIYSRI